MSLRNFFGLALILITLTGLIGFAYFQNQASNTPEVQGVQDSVFSEQGQNGTGLFSGDVAELTTVEGFLGWEKRGFFEDEAVQQILAGEYGLDVEINKKGSIAMVSEPAPNQDYLFPSNKIATEIYRRRNGVSAETVFFSPIVVYTWDSLVNDLQTTGLVSVRDGIHYLNMDQLVSVVENQTTWEELGGQTLQGPIGVTSTDPNKSGSGNLFSALVLSSITEQNPPSTQAVTPEVQARMENFFNSMGLLEASTGDLFDKFLTLGRSTYPLVVGYESQLIELINTEDPNADQLVPLYTEPTVWSEHGFIPLNENGEALQSALLENEQLGKIAWDVHGLRKIGKTVEIGRYQTYGIPAEVGSALPLPQVETLERANADI